jgi:hypothetical protein
MSIVEPVRMKENEQFLFISNQSPHRGIYYLYEDLSQDKRGTQLVKEAIKWVASLP